MQLLLYTLLAAALGTDLVVTATTCSQPSKFGPQCAYDCHCSVDCDKTTGRCPGTCILPWTGPSCQKENVAFSKPTQDSGVFEFNNAWTSSKAVDGNTNQEAVGNSCYLSSYFRPPGQGNPPAPDAWMVVDLGQVYHTHDISVYGRATYSHRMNGTRLFVSNVSNDRQNPCYTFEAPGTRMNDTWDLTCDRRGRYVTIFDNTVAQVDVDTGSGNVFLEVCEIMVFVCSTGTFGSSCDQLCRCRDGSPCDFNGTCPNGCLDGFVGPTCSQACPNGTFGENCTQSCYCKSGTCDVTTGLCNGGCASGWRGPTCSEACVNGTWGEDCVGMCNCLGDPCDPQTGLCPGPCAPGWQDTHCDQRCPVGQFGQNCSRSCFCLEQPCNHVTGFCNSSCQPGWLGSSCSTPCPAESFGANCSLECHCQGQTCNGSTGLCPGVCQPGWLGVSCNVSCSAGSFGTNCTGMCRCKQGTCDHVTGLGCPGCEAGFQGNTCSAPCGPTQFGEDCAFNCNCGSPGCNALNGTCLVPGCLPGFQGDSCSTGCQTGSWGVDCLQTCGNCSSPCDPRDGTCDTCLPGWEGDRCQAIQQPRNPGSSTTGTVIGVVVGCIVVVIAIVLVIFILRFRRTRARKHSSSAKENGLDLDLRPVRNSSGDSQTFSSAATAPTAPSRHRPKSEKSASKLEPSPSPAAPASGAMADDHETYYNLEGLPRRGQGVPIAELAAYVKQGKTDKSFEAEYENLPTGNTVSTTVGQKPENKNKNRFVGYFAYDYNRVKLEPKAGDPHSDYINASYIDSCTEKKVYIASQGTNKHTVADMWRMLWQQKIEKVVMLTNLYEMGKAKCERYWPETGEATYGGFTVRLAEEQVRAPYTIRTLVVSPPTGGEERTVTHFHFTAWPDHGVPETMELVEFQRHVSHHPSPLGSPTVVHCSAGIGRTGTYIAMDALLAYGRKEGSVDLHGFACHMRNQRKNMIQTKEQYVFAHDVLVDAFSHGDKVMTSQQFMDAYKPSASPPSIGTTPLQHWHKELVSEAEDLAEAAKKVIKAAKQPEENVYMNKEDNDAEKEDEEEVFDPVRVPSRTEQRGYYVAEVKGDEDAEDLWRLVFETDASMVLSLEGNPKTLAEYVPMETGQEVTYGDFKVTLSSSREMDGSVFSRDVKVFSTVKRQAEVVQHLSVDCSEHCIHGNLSPIKALVQAVQDNAVPIVVVFRTWLQGAMTVCALRNVAQQVRQDEEADVFNALRLVQRVVPHPPPSLEDFKVCMDFALDRCQGDDNVYANA